jgi:hypothetical protein
MRHILDWARGIMDAARDTYGVNPAVFLILIVACSPFFYFSIYRLARSVIRKSPQGTGLWAAVFLVSTSTPYLYVMIFGRNLPLWVYGVLALLIAQGVCSLVKRIRRSASGGQEPISPEIPPKLPPSAP